MKNEACRMPSPSILRMKNVVQKTGLGRATVYYLIKTGMFPRPITLGRRAIGWRESDVDWWIETRPVAESIKIVA